MSTQRRLCRRRSHTRVCHMFKTMVHRRSSTCCQRYGTRYWTGSLSILQVHGPYPMAHLWGYEPRRSWRSHRVFLTGEDRSVSLVRAFLMRGRVWSAGVPKDAWQIVAQMARVRARCLGAEIELEACQSAAQLLFGSTLPRCRDSRHGDMSKEARVRCLSIERHHGHVVACRWIAQLALARAGASGVEVETLTVRGSAVWATVVRAGKPVRVGETVVHPLCSVTWCGWGLPPGCMRDVTSLCSLAGGAVGWRRYKWGWSRPGQSMASAGTAQ